MDGWEDDDLDLGDLGLNTAAPDAPAASAVEEKKADTPAFEMDFFEQLASGQSQSPKLEIDDIFAQVAAPVQPQKPPVAKSVSKFTAEPESTERKVQPVQQPPAATENIVGSLFSFFNNQVVTRATAAVTEGLSQTVGDSSVSDAPPTPAAKEKVVKYSFEDTSDTSEMEKQVMQHLIQENRTLKQQLNAKSEELQRSATQLDNSKEYTEHEFNQQLILKNNEITNLSN